MVRAWVNGRSNSNCPKRTFNAFFGSLKIWPRSLYLTYPSPNPPSAPEPPVEMSSSIQNEKFWPKLPALMMVKVFGAKRSVRGANPFCEMTPAGCLRFKVKLPSYRNAIGKNPGISPGYTALGNASFCAFDPSRTRLLNEGLVVLRKLEPVLLECLAKIVQFRVVV